MDYSKLLPVFGGALVLFILLRYFRNYEKTVICKTCGYNARERRANKGSDLIEILLWLAFIVPGVAYSVWRIGAYNKRCPQCGYNIEED